MSTPRLSTPQFVDEVLVVLTTLDAPATCPFRDRYLLLSPSVPSAMIGRTSKRSPYLGASCTNAWVDSAVMSRKHALIEFDADVKRVFIKDIGSLHGTFHNGTLLDPHQSQRLEQGDILKFGISVERSAQTFPPCVMKVTLNHGTEPWPEGKPVVFRVPDDDSDLDNDLVSDDDFSIRNSARILRENGVGPAKADQVAGSIDLTSDDGDTAEQDGSSKPKEKDTTTGDETGTTTRQGQMETPPADDNGRERQRSKAQGWQEMLGHDQGLLGQDSSPAPGLDVGKASDQAPSLDDGFGVGDADEWDGYSSVPSISAAPASHDCSVAALAGTSDMELPSPYDGEEEELESGDGFGLGQVSSTRAANMPSLACRRDDAEPEQSMDAGRARASKKTATEGESGMMQDGEQPAQYCCNPRTTVMSGTRAEQLAIQSRRSEMCQSLAPSLERLHLPPMAVMGSITPVAPQLALRSTAEVLGPRTGKFEFFAARDHNKAVVGLGPRGSAAQPRPAAAAQTWCSPERMHKGKRPAEEGRGDCDEDGEDEELDSSFLDGEEKQTALADATTSTLLASGAKFLSSPPRERDREPVAATWPELDETSAYQFELSKKAAGANGAACRRTQVAIQDLVDAYPDKALDEGRPWQKRKAGEQGEEAGGVDGPAGDGAGTGAGTGAGSGTRAREAAAVGEGDESRPAKRFRRVAEALGYAALGGVAVMSALIATAPML